VTISEQNMRESLKRHAGWLNDKVHSDLVDGFRRDGLIDDGATRAVAQRLPGADADVDAVSASAAARGLIKLSPIQASHVAQSNPNLSRLFNRVRAQATRYGIPLGDTLLSVSDIDAKLKAAGASLDQRMEFKGALHTLRLI